MFDLQLMAFRLDITCVFSMVMARELSGRSYANIGVPGNHHLISHHRNDSQLMDQKARIDTYHIQMWATSWRRCAPRPMATAAARPQPGYVRQRHGRR